MNEFNDLLEVINPKEVILGDNIKITSIENATKINDIRSVNGFKMIQYH